jgi:TIR domain-containing protein
MPDIFISYRREDSAGHAGRLFDCIRERFGDESVFMDVTDIRPGDDFTTSLDSALSSCRVVLVIIGKQWLPCVDASGHRRLDDPEDHLRMEIAHALKRNARVIPVLVRGAAMPSERDLPEELRGLARRQAHEVSDSRWSFDTNQLVRIIENALGAPVRAAQTPARESTNVAGRWMRVAPAAAVFLILIALTVYLKWLRNGAPAGSAGTPGSSAAGAAVVPVRNAGVASSPAATPLARLPPAGEARAGAAIFKVLGGLVGRGDEGPHTVRLYVRTTNVAAPYGFNIGPDSFRLIVGGDAISPEEAPIDVVAMQSALEGWVTFRVPPSAASVAFGVGEIRQATAKIPIDLRSAGSAVTEKPAPTWRSPVDIAAAFEKRVGPLVYRIDGMRLEHFADAVPPLQPEKLELTIKIRLTNVGAASGYAVASDEFRLLVDDVPLAPTTFPSQVLTHQAGADTKVVFIVPGTATNTVLQLGNLNTETVRIPLDLSAGH